jgi:hypothetical protein
MNALNRPLLLSVLCLAMAFLSWNKALAQSPKDASPAVKIKPREFSEFVKNLPKSDLSKLGGSKQNEIADALSNKVREAEANKEGVFRLPMGRVETFQFAEQTENGWRIECHDQPVRHGGVTFNVDVWIYVRKDPDKMLSKARPGQDVTVTGKVTEAPGIRMVAGVPTLGVNIDAVSLKMGK